mmetsp:Transcript_15836/g.43125  ORF Transcript_15836/g.43125 Transcript_15836/m.43125 type:complete len:364 (-) Transcript_15836:856-1947(-)
MVALVGVERALSLVRGVPVVLRGVKQRPAAHGTRDGEYRVEASEQRAEQEHLADARVHRHLREVPPQRREPLVNVKRAKVLELGECAVHRHDVGRGQRRGQGARHGLVGGHGLDRQAELLQRGPEHLRRLLRRRVGKLRAGEHGEPGAGRGTTRPTAALLRGSLRDPRVGEHGQAAVRVPAHLLRAPGVDHVSDVVNRHGGFGDVRGDDDLPHTLRRALEDLTLVLAGERAVQGQDSELAHVRRVEEPGLLQLSNQLCDFKLTGHEHEHRAEPEILRRLARDGRRNERGGPFLALHADDVRDELFDGVVVDHGLVHVLNGPLRLRRVIHGEQPGRLGERVVAHPVLLGRTERCDGAQFGQLRR